MNYADKLREWLHENGKTEVDHIHHEEYSYAGFRFSFGWQSPCTRTGATGGWLLYKVNERPDILTVLEKLQKEARSINARQHAGMIVDASDWADLNMAEEAARAAIEKARTA